MKHKILIITNSIWYTVNFRLNLAKELRRLGFDVIAVAPGGTGDKSLLRDAGVDYINIPIDSKGANPFSDLIYLLRLLRVIYNNQPLVCLSFTVKPNIYCGLACQILGKAVIQNISGLGTTFIKTNWLTSVVKVLYRISLRRSFKVFFQNTEDREMFVKMNLVEGDVAELLPGSGVDTDWFTPAQSSCDNGRPFRFLLSARLLWDKGVGEYVSAARLLLSEGLMCEFLLLGFADFANRTAVSHEDIRQWENEGVLRFLGSTDDVRPYIAEADCVVLPSYREGTPRALLEAASMCKPIITSNAIGCHNTVEDGITGFVCNVRDHFHLAEKMREMMALSVTHRKNMGKKGREKMIKEYSEKVVIDRYIRCVKVMENCV